MIKLCDAGDVFVFTEKGEIVWSPYADKNEAIRQCALQNGLVIDKYANHTREVIEVQAMITTWATQLKMMQNELRQEGVLE